LFATADEERQRELAAVAAERAVEAVGLDRDPAVAAALRALRTSPGAPLAADGVRVVGQGLHELSLAGHAVNDPQVQSAALARYPELARRANALNALYQATNPDPLAAALEAVKHASSVLGNEVLLAEVSRILAASS
jgi:hypothetical protein